MKKNNLKIFSILLFLLYIIFLLWRVFFYAYGGYHRHYVPSIQINIIPFKTISTYLLHYNNVKFNIWFFNLFGNIIAFMPFGILLPFVKKAYQSSKSIIITTFFSSLFIEILQMIFRVGTADIDDLILNTMGGYIGYRLWIEISKWFVINDKEE